ncbi:hypothetical protein [Anaerophilus nitritogenes]|nr:hypothetical protein [Anaerophilus nitritogenes]
MEQTKQGLFGCGNDIWIWVIAIFFIFYIFDGGSPFFGLGNR